MAIKQIVCSGTPYEIGHKHGSQASEEIYRAIAFYAKMFAKHSNLDWPQVQELARDFEGLIKHQWPRYYEELKGIADGAKTDLIDIIALNVRTEIVFGRFSDGCTSLYYQDSEHSFQGQNWDWDTEQAANLIQLTVIQQDLPTIKMITEAGIIGKIGLNSTGVGVCFNAIRAKGLDKTRIPVHLGLRIALESSSALQAVENIEKVGMASSAHILIGDATTAIGLEFTSSTFARIPLNQKAFIVHSNHMLLPHPGIDEPAWLKDSPVRVQTMGENIEKLQGVLSWETFCGLFRDEANYPCSINRAADGESDMATLFNIVMDLRTRRVEVIMGRPSDAAAERIILAFE
ncbi:acyl-coenzyme A:6-aminopenicillanic acid acyl-transferase-domain-containing protein [Aspergillus foveolatus]|uniref:acyl-coenzyme A:6-aminopenicillanic acid acyl-transferase-domain-containing protein n=1 Tax=Aspergillus foveolatus TaxID=210207 RepID=UPI003CCE22E6